MRCSPRKPPRLSRQYDAVGKGLSTLAQITIPVPSQAAEDCTDSRAVAEGPRLDLVKDEDDGVTPMETSDSADVSRFQCLTEESEAICSFFVLKCAARLKWRLECKTEY